MTRRGASTNHMLYHMRMVRHTFPLHYIVFKQVSSHLGHEANSEQLFSRSGKLSDDNGKMDPHRLAVWTSIGVNRRVYEPSVQQIMERYFLKFSKGGKTVHDDDLGLIDPDGDVNAADGGYYARWVEPQPQNLTLASSIQTETWVLRTLGGATAAESRCSCWHPP